PGGEIWLPGNGTELVLSSKHQEKPPKPITDPRIAALVRSHRPGGAVVYHPASAENPRRRVVVVYISRDLIGADPPLRGKSRAVGKRSYRIRDSLCSRRGGPTASLCEGLTRRVWPWQTHAIVVVDA